jgi:hypothetical protein
VDDEIGGDPEPREPGDQDGVPDPDSRGGEVRRAAGKTREDAHEPKETTAT